MTNFILISRFSWPLMPARCEKKCCNATQIPLRVCKAITIYKSQGTSVGEGETWELVVVCLPAANAKSAPGLEQVALSRAKALNFMAIMDDEGLTYEQFLNIGKGAAYEKRRAFELRLRDLAEQSQAQIKAKIIALDPDRDNATFLGGFNALLNWYNARTAS